MPTFDLELIVRAPVELCFDIGLDIELHLDCFKDHGERAVAGVTSGRLGPGDWVTWEARHLGLRRRLTNQITRYDRPHMFQDETIRGAFHRFSHLHLFESVPEGARLREHLEYESPLGWAGRLADRLFLERYLKALVHKRAAYLRQVAERLAKEQSSRLEGGGTEHGRRV